MIDENFQPLIGCNNEYKNDKIDYGIYNLDWEDIMGSDSDSDTDNEGVIHLGRITPDFMDPDVDKVKPHGFVEITLNYPRVSLFTQKTSNGQANFLRNWWNKVFPKNLQGFGDYCNMYYLEHCKNGVVHVHGTISVDKRQFNIASTVCDVAKLIHASLPKKYKKFIQECYYIPFERYRTPAFVVQYREFNDPKHAEWNNYIRKDIRKNNLN